MVRRLRQIAFFSLTAGLITTAALAQQQAPRTGHTALLRALDKVTARTTDLYVPVGGSVRFGTLTIQVDYCRTRPPEEQPESFVLLTVQDRPPERPARVVFDGWMLASIPALNPLEHPVYDLWAIGCEMDDTDERVEQQ